MLLLGIDAIKVPVQLVDLLLEDLALLAWVITRLELLQDGGGLGMRDLELLLRLAEHQWISRLHLRALDNSRASKSFCADFLVKVGGRLRRAGRQALILWLVVADAVVGLEQYFLVTPVLLVSFFENLSKFGTSLFAWELRLHTRDRPVPVVLNIVWLSELGERDMTLLILYVLHIVPALASRLLRCHAVVKRGFLPDLERFVTYASEFVYDSLQL